ncbi:cell division protein FtsA [Clostridium algidicarnis]|uniref:cell division protein FtsA n=1 Tax=Clostridium algidicarnis TaxID=37659 RepID=UPI001C0B3CE5|nr:cell division FtsA domain-containing protein [Clostridium algidicarnis]MBU3196120.1 rod shape-determining protein [Clostridium algidicarnis]MBU3209162.1 rod shape-determining protein [Clostridium algidicarnis]MBU3229001.1 rod shape-determining protein [Clostridium algidicarnis]MBU3252580.1 rod shape-determining protein [Clostridium algidicarnis]
MDKINIDPKDIIFALDIGTRSVIGSVGIVENKKLKVIAEHYVEHEERSMVDGQIHDINKVSESVEAVKLNLEDKLGVKLKEVAIAAAGRFLRTTKVKADLDINEDKEISKEALRKLELTAVNKAEDETNKSSNGKLYCVGYSIVNYYLNGYVISNLLSHKGKNIGVEVIATFLPRTVIDSLYSVMNKLNLKVVSLTLEPIAAIEAAIPKNLRLLNLALVDIGAGTSDIAISNKDSISAFGMVQMAGDEITEVIAQNCLVDFNTAEIIKKSLLINEDITYKDVLGLENKVKSETIIKLILPVVDKITDAIAHKILELNGDKSPSAVFFVGGGAHTPYIREKLSEKLNIPLERTAIKGREAILECICLDNSLGSIGVTVLGIGLMAIKSLGENFIDVYLNGDVISLFNVQDHKVIDALLQAGINPKMLVGHNGKNIRFTLNGSKRLAFGSLGKNSTIFINGKEGSLDSTVKEGDTIDVKFALDGKDSEPNIKEYIKSLDSVSFFYNDEIQNLEPKCMINGKEKAIDSIIKDEDSIEIINILTLKDFKYYILKEEGIFRKDGKALKDDYIIREGDRIYKDITLNNKGDNNLKNKLIKDESIEIIVNINGDEIILKGKKEYIFVDIFDYINFDLTMLKGKITLKLNEKEASYVDKLKDGDIIKVYWS